MKAVRLIRAGSPLELQDVPVPEPGPKDVLVEVKAAGICHSDAHYRAGRSRVDPLPMTLGHEVAGVVAKTGSDVEGFKTGDRVCIHYLATCGACAFCSNGTEQFCPSAAMIGKCRDGGFAEFILMPAASVFRLPPEISFEHGAVMMCSAATSLHALNKARLKAGESVAIFGVGGLGVSAIQLATAFRAGKIFAVDIKADNVKLAEELGATPIDASRADPVTQIQRLTGGRGVDVALELIGLPVTMRQAVQSLAIQGRVGIVGISEGRFEVDSYNELLNKETEIIGVSDHLASELPQLINYARQGRLDISRAITEKVPLNAAAINEVLDRLERFGSGIRSVITP